MATVPHESMIHTALRRGARRPRPAHCGDQGPLVRSRPGPAHVDQVWTTYGMHESDDEWWRRVRIRRGLAVARKVPAWSTYGVRGSVMAAMVGSAAAACPGVPR